MKKGKNKNDKVCGIMKTEKGARNLDKKNFQIQYNSRLCLQGCILAALGILGPTLIAEQRLGIYDDLTTAMMYECSGALISAALKLVCMNVVRMIPHYLGAFLINESVHILTCLSLPENMRLLAAGISIPLFGAVSSFGASSVPGVPFALAFLNMHTVYTVAALSFIASLGDMMPPTALAGLFAVQVTGVDNYVKVLKRCLIPMAVMLVYGLIFIYFSKPIAALF